MYAIVSAGNRVKTFSINLYLITKTKLSNMNRVLHSFLYEFTTYCINLTLPQGFKIYGANFESQMVTELTNVD
jgi:hypothetical protein